MILSGHLLDILAWKDINETIICCIKTLKYFLSVLEVLVCLVGSPAKAHFCLKMTQNNIKHFQCPLIKQTSLQ
jgi:hypothetical protein